MQSEVCEVVWKMRSIASSELSQLMSAISGHGIYRPFRAGTSLPTQRPSYSPVEIMERPVFGVKEATSAEILKEDTFPMTLRESTLVKSRVEFVCVTLPSNEKESTDAGGVFEDAAGVGLEALDGSRA